ncbi:MAG: phospho-sugar mutase [Anaerolineaceae bacterium]|nr:phospho-sugar mutase [Anaerolineaceae bacterium]
MDSNKVFSRWLEFAAKAKDLMQELKDLDPIRDKKEIYDRFYRDLEFGTGGLRGVIGAGTNRMNIFVIRKVTQGLCDYLKESGEPLSVAIGYDSRIKSDVFAREAACVCAANGITAYHYPHLVPTPAVSWAVRYYHCGAGINVTASHNPSKYNGYKVYGSDGCQITPEAADKVLAASEKTDPFTDVKLADYEEAIAAGMIKLIPTECLEAFVDAVLALRPGNDVSALKLVYTPLNGAGLECIKMLLEKMGVKNVTVVPEQEKPDGNFPTCPYPNPEIREAMELGLKLVKEQNADLMIGTDPDCDRMGAACPDGKGDYRLITGNEMGVLLLEYLCRTRIANGSMPKDPVAVTTIVSTDMVTPIAEEYGVELRRTLTGFKFIGEQIAILEAAGHPERFIFGFEESYGYLSGPHVRDKDAVNATMLAVECAASYAAQGMTLLDAINALYDKYGWFRNAQINKAFEGAEGMVKMGQVMDSLRNDPPAAIGTDKVVKFIDYQNDDTGLIKSNVLEYRLENGSKVIARPSGTEPKLKLYLSVKGKTDEDATQLMEALNKDANELLLSRM